jgi:adenylate cyclase
MRLRTKIFFIFAPLVVATLLATLLLTQWAVSRQTEATLRSQLAVTGQVFSGLLAARAERLLTQTALLAGDFALKRAIATYDPKTLASVAVNYRERISVDRFWITDEKGVLLADARGDPVRGRTLADRQPLAQALQGEEDAAAIGEVGGAVYQLAAVPVLAPDLIGLVLVGQAIDDATAHQLEGQTGSQVTFLTAEQIFASSWSVEERHRLLADQALARHLSESVREKPFLMNLDGERWLSYVVPVDATLPSPLYALVQRSYDRALAPLWALRRRFAIIGLVALIAALLGGAGLAAAIAAPLQVLVAAMREVRGGNLRKRVVLQRSDEIGYLAGSFDEMVEGLEERERIKETFGRFVSKEVATAVLSGSIPMHGERREVTILFQDIRGFTTLSEKADPAELVVLLNRFFTEIVAAVESEGGIVGTFTGDGVMALFGAPVTHADDPERAVRAALDMQGRIARLNAVSGREPIRIGVGVHTGEVIAGQIGPDERVSYNVVGDPVNTASRIEGLTKEMKAGVLVSQTTAARLGPAFVLGRREVLPIRGREESVEVVEVLGVRM